METIEKCSRLQNACLHPVAHCSTVSPCKSHGPKWLTEGFANKSHRIAKTHAEDATAPTQRMMPTLSSSTHQEFQDRSFVNHQNKQNNDSAPHFAIKPSCRFFDLKLSLQRRLLHSLWNRICPKCVEHALGWFCRPPKTRSTHRTQYHKACCLHISQRVAARSQD